VRAALPKNTPAEGLVLVFVLFFDRLSDSFGVGF
jgi:hypothetical protein